MMVASITETVIIARSIRPFAAAPARAAAIIASPPAGPRIAEQPTAVPGIDLDPGGQARTQLRHVGRLLDPDPHRHALGDPDPVSRRVLRRDQRALGARRGGDRLHGAAPRAA